MVGGFDSQVIKPTVASSLPSRLDHPFLGKLAAPSRAALQRSLHGEGLGHLANSHVSEPSWKWEALATVKPSSDLLISIV